MELIEGQGQEQAGLDSAGRAARSPSPGQSLLLQAWGPHRCWTRSCGGQSCSPRLTRMARNTGKRRIHQKPMLLLVVQHLHRGERGAVGQLLSWPTAKAWHGISSPG